MPPKSTSTQPPSLQALNARPPKNIDSPQQELTTVMKTDTATSTADTPNIPMNQDPILLLPTDHNWRPLHGTKHPDDARRIFDEKTKIAQQNLNTETTRLRTQTHKTSIMDRVQSTLPRHPTLPSLPVKMHTTQLPAPMHDSTWTTVKKRKCKKNRPPTDIPHRTALKKIEIDTHIRQKLRTTVDITPVTQGAHNLVLSQTNLESDKTLHAASTEPSPRDSLGLNSMPPNHCPTHKLTHRTKVPTSPTNVDIIDMATLTKLIKPFITTPTVQPAPSSLPLTNLNSALSLPNNREDPRNLSASFPRSRSGHRKLRDNRVSTNTSCFPPSLTFSLSTSPKPRDNKTHSKHIRRTHTKYKYRKDRKRITQSAPAHPDIEIRSIRILTQLRISDLWGDRPS